MDTTPRWQRVGPAPSGPVVKSKPFRLRKRITLTEPKRHTPLKVRILSGHRVAVGRWIVCLPHEPPGRSRAEWMLHRAYDTEKIARSAAGAFHARRGVAVIDTSSDKLVLVGYDGKAIQDNETEAEESMQSAACRALANARRRELAELMS